MWHNALMTRAGFLRAWLALTTISGLLAAAPKSGTGLSLPLHFEPRNGGFVARQAAFGLTVTSSGFDIYPRNASPLKVEWLGASRDATLSGLDALPGHSNYYSGTDPSKWSLGVPHFARVQIKSVYPGIDVVLYEAEGAVEYDFVVAPGYLPDPIRLKVVGAKSMGINEAGDLTIEAEGGANLRHQRPRCYQIKNEKRVEIPSWYKKNSEDVVTVETGPFDHSVPLTVDPKLVFSSYYGGSGSETAMGVALDGSSSIYLTGTATSGDLPSRQGSRNGEIDVYVAKINQLTRTIDYSTYFGGSVDADFPSAITADAAGNVYVTGTPGGPDFPLINPIRSNYTPLTAFLTKLTPSGTLAYSTFLGGTNGTIARSVAVDGFGNAYVAGTTSSADFPAINGYQARHSPATDAFLVKVNPAGSALLFASVFGGDQTDFGNQVSLDPSGNIIVTGTTNSRDFPLLNSVVPVPDAAQPKAMAFVTKFNPAGTTLIFSTLLGEGDAASAENTFGRGVTTDSSGNVYVVGTTGARNFPLISPIQRSIPLDNCFLARLSPTGALTYSTLLGGSLSDDCYGVAVDGSRRIWVAGTTNSRTTPLVDALFPDTSSYSTNVIFQIASDGSSIQFSTFFGSRQGQVFPSNIAIDGIGDVYLAGTSVIPDVPLVDPLTTPKTPRAYVSRISGQSQCTYTLGPPVPAVLPVAGGTGSMTVTTQPGCYWNAVGNSLLMRMGDGLSQGGDGLWTDGRGPGQFTYTVGTGEGPDRVFDVIAAGKRVTITQQGYGCSLELNPAQRNFTPAGGPGSFLTGGTSGCFFAPVVSASWITITSGPTSGPIGEVAYTISQNSTGTARTGTITVNGVLHRINQGGTYVTVGLNPAVLNLTGLSSGPNIAVTTNGPWVVSSNRPWLVVSFPFGKMGTGNGIIGLSVEANTSSTPRTGAITVNTQTIPVTQGPAGLLTFDPPSVNVPAAGGSGTVRVTTNYPDYSWFPRSQIFWASVSGAGYGSGSFNYTVQENKTTAPRTTEITLEDFRYTITQAAAAVVPTPVSTGLHFVPVNPCRVVDTRENPGEFGKPSLAGGVPRAFRIPYANCQVTIAAKAYSLNVTVVPKAPLGYLTIWPTGAVQPLVSTLNSVDGRVKANAAIVPAGVDGAVSVFATGDTDLVIDVNGYFIDFGTQPAELAFYPVAPCRVVDTRNAAGPLGGPAIGTAPRDFSPRLSNCNIPASARAYSLNATVVPNGPLGYLTLWPAGSARPLVSTLNAGGGGIVANAAIVLAGTNGFVSAYGSSSTHLVLDINGYFAPPGAANAMRFFPIAPCRLLDTRNPTASLGGPILAGSQARNFPLLSGACNILDTARAYSLNATVVPETALGYLTLWPTAESQPLVSTLNALDDPIVANAAIVPAGLLGAVSAFVTNRTHLILDTNGYFAP